MNVEDDYEKDTRLTKELSEFLQGDPKGCTVAEGHMPQLTADQAATVIWWLGNRHWQVTDHVSPCCICGDYFNEWSEGEVIDGGPAPYFFCDCCKEGDDAAKKRRLMRKFERSQNRRHLHQ